MNKIKSIVVGLGKVGLYYDLPFKKTKLSHSNSIHCHHSFELLGGVDLKKKSRNDFTKYYKKPTFSKVNKAIKKFKPNLVIISTPTKNHIRVVKEIILNKTPELNSLIIEKPSSYNRKETSEILKICNKSKVKLFINYPFVYDKGIQKIKKILKKNKFNDMVVNITYSKGFYHIASHLVKICIYFFGKPNKFLKLNSLKNKDDFFFNGFINFKKANVYFNYNKKINTKMMNIVYANGQILIDLNSMNIWSRNKIRRLDNNNLDVLDKYFKKIENSQNIIQYSFYDSIRKKIKYENQISKNNINELFIDNFLNRMKKK